MMIRKIVLLGEMAVGKTSIARRLKFDSFDAEYKSTIGMNIYQYEIAPAPNGTVFIFTVCDTDGKFDDALFRDQHVKGAEAAIVVGDLTRRETLETQVDLVYKFSDAIPGRYVGCVLNKTDLIEDEALLDDIARDVKYIPEKLRNASFPIYKTSAKTGENVRDTFHDAASAIVRRKL